MKWLFCAIVITLCSAGTCVSQASGKLPRVIVIHRPTIVAFFLPMTGAEANSGEVDAEALGDFNFYAYKVGERLKKAGIEFQQVSGRSFQIRDGMKTRTFQASKIAVGYYFIAPGKGPHVEYGVMTDEDLADAAQRYFGIPIQKADCAGSHCSK